MTDKPSGHWGKAVDGAAVEIWRGQSRAGDGGGRIAGGRAAESPVNGVWGRKWPVFSDESG